MLALLALSACSAPAPAPAPAPPASDPGAPAAAPEAPSVAPGAPADRPPRVTSIELLPASPRAADTLTAKVVAVDPENAALDVDVTWFVNDVEVLGVTATTLSGRFVKGDRVRVRVNVEDQTHEITEDGPSVTIVNGTPVLVPPPSLGALDGVVFRATDPDGDPLTWSLQGAPAGLTIGRTGELSYVGSAAEPGGAYTVSVVVSDGDASGRYEFPLTVSPGSEAAAKR